MVWSLVAPMQRSSKIRNSGSEALSGTTYLGTFDAAVLAFLPVGSCCAMPLVIDSNHRRRRRRLPWLSRKRKCDRVPPSRNLSPYSAKTITGILGPDDSRSAPFDQRRYGPANMRAMLLLLMVCSSSIAAPGSPLCGVAPAKVHKSGFENGEVAPPPYVPQPGLPSDLTPLALAVTFPGDGITVGTKTIQVHGTFSGPPNTGISVNGIAALQAGTSYLSRDVPLQPGANSITVTVTGANGSVQTVSRSVTLDANQAPDVELTSAFAGDYAPFSLRYLVSVRPGVSNPIVERIRIDYDSNGTFETDTTNPATRLTSRHQSVGLVVTSAEITLNDGNTNTPPVVVTATRRVLGEDLDVTRATMCKAFETHRNNLSAQQYTAALQVFNAEVRPNYQSFIEGLGSNGATVAAGLGQIVDGTIGQESAELALARPIPGQPGRFHNYPLQFTRDGDGVWRISAL